MEGLSRDLLRVSRKAQRCAGIVAKKYGISIAEEPFFMAVTVHDGATQEELTELVGVDKTMTTRVIHALMQKGLVEKISDPNDRRRNRIYQTENMKAIRTSVSSELLSLNQIITAEIDGDALDTFMGVLSALEDNISAFLAQNESDPSHKIQMSQGGECG